MGRQEVIVSLANAKEIFFFPNILFGISVFSAFTTSKQVLNLLEPNEFLVPKYSILQSIVALERCSR